MRILWPEAAVISNLKNYISKWDIYKHYILKSPYNNFRWYFRKMFYFLNYFSFSIMQMCIKEKMASFRLTCYPAQSICPTSCIEINSLCWLASISIKYKYFLQEGYGIVSRDKVFKNSPFRNFPLWKSKFFQLWLILPWSISRPWKGGKHGQSFKTEQNW